MKLAIQFMILIQVFFGTHAGIVLPTARASLQAVQIGFQKEIPQTRWIFDKKSKDLKPASKSMAELKNFQVNKNLKACSDLAKKLFNTQKIVRPWILSVQFECELGLVENKKAAVGQLRVLNQQLNLHPDWLLSGPYSPKLRIQIVRSYFAILDWEIKNRPQNAWGSVGNLLDLQDWMSPQEKARAFQMAGELSFLQQNLQTARAYILKSLDIVDDPKLRDKLNSIESTLMPKQAVKTQADSKSAENIPIILGQKEQEIADRMTLALKAGDLFSATQDGVELIEDYPGSIQADWAAQRIMESYQNIVAQDEKQFKVLRYDFLNVMKRADSKRLLDWAKRAYKLGQYKDAAAFSEEAFSKSKGDIALVEILDLAAKSYLSLKDTSSAEKFFKILTEKYSGTRESVEAFFYLGLIQYMNKEYAKAQSYFEKVISQIQFPDLELSSRYWLWRASQKVDDQRAQIEVQFLINKFPFSYYGLRAASETNKGEISFEPFQKKLLQKQELWLTPLEKQAWERFQTLSAAGWYEEAGSELKEIPLPMNPEGQAMLARYFAAAFEYPKAIQMLNKAWDENSNLRVMPLILTAFPKEFSSIISEQAGVRKLNPKLIMSLIRQESSFDVDAQSTSGALGLMQIIPPTAKEIAQNLKIKNLEIPGSLFEPDVNIRMGTYYLAKLVTDFGDNIPFALAAYNAGPTKIKRWMQSMQIAPQSTSSPEHEIWIDMLPWSETKFYVKAILRNFLIYQLLESNKIQVKDPVWASSQG